MECLRHDAQSVANPMRPLLSLAAAASLLLALPAHAQFCRGHRGWAALGYRQGVAMRWFKEHGREVAADYAEQECNKSAACTDYLEQRCAYQE